MNTINDEWMQYLSTQETGNISQILSQENRKILKEIMLHCGWDFYQNEWWHYQLFNPRNYAIIQNFKI